VSSYSSREPVLLIVIFIRYDLFKFIFVKLQQKLTTIIITIKVIGQLCDTMNMNKVVIKILQGSVVTKTLLGGLTIYPPVANFVQCVCVKIIKMGWR